jgi:hypothetical protein
LDVLKTLQNLERILGKEAHRIDLKLNGVRKALKALERAGTGSSKRKRRLSAKDQAGISTALKKRWAAAGTQVTRPKYRQG